MRRLGIFLLSVALTGAGVVVSADGAAVDIRGAEIDTALERTASQPDSDQLLRMLNIGNDYNLGISVVHRARTAARPIGPAAEHSAVTEIFHFISGTGTLVTGGTLDAPQPVADNPVAGPGMIGSRIINGHIRGVGPGDVVVVPPNTPVQFTEVNSGELVYLVLRVDPHKVLTAATR